MATEGVDMTDNDPGRHVATEREETRGEAHTNQPEGFLTREAVLDAMVTAAGEPAFLDRLATGLVDRIGAIPTAGEIAQALEDIRAQGNPPADQGHGQAHDDDDEQPTPA